MKQLSKLFILLFTLWLGAACSSSNNSPEEEKIYDGLNYSPSSPNADEALKITFKAPVSSALYGYSGDVYIHTGVISEGTWVFVPASWSTNIDKCKMAKDADSQWSITLAPSIRNWFSSGSTPVNKLGIVIRSSDGTKKGIDNDSFVSDRFSAVREMLQKKTKLVSTLSPLCKCP